MGLHAPVSLQRGGEGRILGNCIDSWRVEGVGMGSVPHPHDL